MKSICKSLEDKLLESLRGLPGVSVPVEGLLEVAAAGELKDEEPTSLQVKVYGMQQPHESMRMYTVTAELRLYVEQAESANGRLFSDTHEAVALWLEGVMLDDACTALETSDVFVDGLQVTGGDLDFDNAGGEWFASWNLTLTGRKK